jgi:cobyrinic acid a,c-diamide synthase
MDVQPFKVGPDYLDPYHHTLASGKPSWALDSWMLGPEGVRESFIRGSRNAGIAVIEGMMGLYDGASGNNDSGSTAEVARLLGSPVILVIDASGLARSAGALVQGYRDFDPNVNLAGVIANRVAGAGHLEYLRPSIEGRLGIPLLGGLPHDPSLTLPERHLGLALPEDDDAARSRIQGLSEWVIQHLDLERIQQIACSTTTTEGNSYSLVSNTPQPSAKPPVRIALAHDPAFCFYYPENLRLLEMAGAELAFFSPVRDAALPENIDGLYMGGGYPELYAQELADNVSMRASIAEAIRDGVPTLAECGGFMYLCERLVLANKQSYPMVGVVPGQVIMGRSLQAIGYREVTLRHKCPLGPAGETLRGHEFRYSRHESAIPAAAAAFDTAQGPLGYTSGSLVASYVHLHFGSNPRAATCFVSHCALRRPMPAAGLVLAAIPTQLPRE